MPILQRPSILAYLVSLGLIATLPLIALLTYNVRSQYQSDRKDAIALIEPLHAAYTQQIRAYLDDLARLLTQLAHEPAVQSFDRAGTLVQLQKAHAIRPDLGNLALLDQDGRVITAVRFSPEGSPEPMRDRAWIKEALDTDGFHAGPAFVGNITHRWSSLLSYPVRDASGRRLGTLVAPLELEELSRRFFHPQASADFFITVFDAQGTQLMRSSQAPGPIGTPAGLRHGALTDSGSDRLVSTFTNEAGRAYLYTIGRIPGTHWSIGIAIPHDVIFASALANQRRSLILFGGLVLLLGGFVIGLARYLGRPIASLAQSARDGIAGRPSQPALVGGPAEIAETAQAFNEMVAARQRSEQTLAESEHRYRTVLDQTGQMIYDLDATTGVNRWFGTAAIQAITGHSLEEFQPVDRARWAALIHPEDRAHATTQFETALRQGTPYAAEYRFRHRDGTYRHIEDRGVFLRTAPGQVNRLLGRMSDITSRKLATATLRQIIDLVPHLIFAKDQTGRYVLANQAMARAYGTTPESLVGRTDADFIRDQDELRDFVLKDQAVLSSGRPLHIPEEKLTDHTGRPRFLSTIKIPFFFALDGQPTVLGISADITELKQAADERQLIEKKLLETQKLESLGVLAGGIAHDFNNLLTGIIGNAGLARLDLSPGSPTADYLAQIEKTSLRAADLCKQMLAYSGKGRFVIQRLDLNELLRDTTQLLTISINKKSVLRFNLDPTLPPIQADATQLRQVLMNLVINASEAIGDRPGTIVLSTGHLTATSAYLANAHLAGELAPGDYIYLEVGDDGIGMTPETVARIFDPFYTTKFTGRGLGLAAVHGIVQGHKGAIRVYSEPGQGTTFKLYFPSITGTVDPLPASTPPTAHWRGVGRALVVDDEDSVRQVCARLMTRLGYAVDTAPDGLVALDLFRQHPGAYAVVLLDLTMPHLDGEETFRQLRHLQPDVRIILMSGFNKVEAINRFLGKGLAGFVQKPFEVDTLAAELRRVAQSTSPGDPAAPDLSL